jgi:hypothetical protein
MSLSIEINGKERHGFPVNPCRSSFDWLMEVPRCAELIDWWIYTAWCLWHHTDIVQVEERRPRWFCIERRGNELWPVWRLL